MHYETNDWFEGKSLVYRWTIATDAQGNLVEIAAVQHPDQFTADQLRSLVIAPMGTILLNKQLPDKIPYWDQKIRMELVFAAGKNFFPGTGVSPSLEVVPAPTQ